MDRRFPKADVIWWNATCYYVRCPFCEALHRHRVNSLDWQANDLRKSHCETSETYFCCFPMNDKGEVAYEINKERGRYVNICISDDSNIEDDDDGDIDQLAADLAKATTAAADDEEISMNIPEDAKELPFQQKRITQSIRDCIAGHTRAVQEYLETSAEARLFVRGRFPFNGKTTLIRAAAESIPEMLSLLIEHGADVNAVDNGGRSALMEAALFGRVNNVKVLLQHGADTNIRDVKNRLAVYFAQEHDELQEERNDRTDDYFEDSPKAALDRREIVRLLSAERRMSKTAFGEPPTVSLSQSYSRTSSSTEEPKPIGKHPISGVGETVARLERGGKFPSVAAISRVTTVPGQPLSVEGRHWADDVFYIAKTVGHHFPSHIHDEDIVYHAEKQLIAYFIDRHAFLPRDLLPDPNLREEYERTEDEIERFYSSTEIGREVTHLRKTKQDLKYELLYKSEELVRKDDEIQELEANLRAVEAILNRVIDSPRARSLQELECKLEILDTRRWRHRDLIRMAEAPPLPATLTKAAILVNKAPCDDCKAFTDKVNKYFGLSIQLFAAV
ncbi:ankyrin [Aspergillus eucalypticola CBS 122712]|uniref:Ankyrin n=1 Tax=Aspergillus eucalypticola (strain CBS 122712 / IBT 29274) TaxID=1448314 RepID=A0A317V272_ASPEC|nr:ankyrin [Aspergillus eucalypticola CBS 122712]PWY66907.1 ankyrin [Aspergillus eucalypticola CBS 122712]